MQISGSYFQPFQPLLPPVIKNTRLQLLVHHGIAGNDQPAL